MNYLDLYLQKHNFKRYDVHKKTGISQQSLATYTNKNVEKYTAKLLIALSETLDKTPGDVLNELIALENESLVFEAYNPPELLSGLKDKYDTIIISGKYCSEIYTLMKSQNIEYDLMGGAPEMGVLISAISSIKNLFSNPDSKIDNEIYKKLKLYEIKEISDDKLVLILK